MGALASSKEFQNSRATVRQVMISLGALVTLAIAVVMPQGAFSIDEVIYIDMARAMSQSGTLSIPIVDAPVNAPALTKSNGLMRVDGNQIMPQYPALYAFIAAPFYSLLGVNGLMLLNALAAIGCLFLTHAIGMRLFADRFIAGTATLLLGGASIFSSYVIAIWPHMLALLFTLAGALATLSAGSNEERKPLAHAAFAGVMFGYGVGIRVDVILGAVAALFWLRIVALPANRKPAIFLLIGLVAPLVLCAFLNDVKFGVFNPFSYGRENGNDSILSYIPVISIGLSALALSFWFNTTASFCSQIINNARQVPTHYWLGTVAICLIAIAIIFHSMFRNFYYLLIDIQAYARSSPGVVQNDAGFFEFWGLPKKALLQSMPYMALIALPAWFAFEGKRVKEAAFLFLFAAAPLVFFSLKGWQGGMAYNMRYFVPATPFIALLCAYALGIFKPILNERKDLFRRLGFLGAGAGILFYTFFAARSGDFTPFFQTAPQLLIGSALLIAIVLFLRDRNSVRFAVATLSLFFVALGYGIVLNLNDTAGYLTKRIRAHAISTELVANIPPASLVITTFEEGWLGAEKRLINVVNAKQYNAAAIPSAISAYQSEGRCVYAHTSVALNNFDNRDFLALSEDVYNNPVYALYAHAGNASHCALSN